jgi:phenylpropionate dioxygenase-like ring-hydroxylating dioxygenase large terminal subunit
MICEGPMIVKNAWYVAAWADEVGPAPLARRICDEPVVLYRNAAGEAAALVDYCCHRGAPLSCGTIVESGLQCGYHGMVYGTDGVCVSIPGQVHIPAKARVRSYPLIEKDALLWIYMGDASGADAAQIVDYPFHADAANWPHLHTMYPVAGSAMLMVDNLMDLTHLAYVHTSTIGGNPKAHIEALMETTPTDTGLKFTRWLLNCSPPPTYKKGAPQLTERVDRWQEFEFIAPAAVLQYVGATDANTGAYDRGERDGGFQLRIFHGLTPATETTSYYFWSGSNGYRQNDPQATVELFAELETAFAEDLHIVGLQQARLTEIGEDPLINIVADGARVHMRRVVEKMLARETAQPALI